jgi:hypothetical protein
LEAFRIATDGFYDPWGGPWKVPPAGPLAGFMGLNIRLDMHSLANIFFEKFRLRLM